MQSNLRPGALDRIAGKEADVADLKIRTTVTITLQPEEFRLVGLALAGALRDGQVEEAHDLNLRLMRLRATQVTEMKRHADKASVAADVGSNDVGHNDPRNK